MYQRSSEKFQKKQKDEHFLTYDKDGLTVFGYEDYLFKYDNMLYHAVYKVIAKEWSIT